MAREMEARERVLAAVEHREGDRVPLALWGSAHGVTDPLYFALLEELGLGEPVAPFRPRMGHTINYYDDRVLEALGVDVRHADLGFTDLGGPSAGGGTDAWGVRYEQRGLYLTAMSYPLGTAEVEELERYAWPRVRELVAAAAFGARARRLAEETPYAVVGRGYDSYGPFERCCSLRKTDEFLVDLAVNEAFAEKLIAKVVDVHCALLEIYLEAAGPYLDIVELPGDDYAALRPIISPAMFDRYFAPAWRRIIGVVREGAPRAKILFHSDGNMAPFLGRLVELGVDIFHCLEPLPGVDMGAIKARYGAQLCFWGAIDIKKAMTGDAAGVEAEVRERIAVLGPGGGYVVAPANHLQPDVPARNVVALGEAVRQWGRYPLGH
jgi:uroporphyrinogen decarboxylase